MASTYLERAASGSVTSDKIFTISTWLKKGANGVQQRWFNHENAASHTQKIDLHFIATDLFRMGWWDGSNEYNLDTVRKFRDVNAWYHFVFRCDTTQSTASDRVRLYVNGELQTLTAIGGGSPTYPAQNGTMNLGQKKLVYGRYQAASPNHYWNGSMTHSHYCDGYSYAPTEFGETDATTGEWKIKTNVSVNYGNNGHFILKDGNSVTDQSGNSNNFTVAGGTLTKTEDNPSNVFATLNPLSNDKTSGITILNGNNTLTTPSGGHDFSITTLGMNSGSGKFYCEVKVSSSANFNMIGISDHSYQGSNQELSEDNYSYGYYSDSGGGSTAGVVRGNGSNVLTGMPNYTTNDIIGIAIDLENHKLYFHKNGTYINSGSPTSGSTGTGAVSIQDLRTVTSNYGNAAYFFGVSDWTTSSGGTYQCNFGNGYFGTTAVSSAGTNASNLGIFEYDVPSGYTALCTKGLNE